MRQRPQLLQQVSVERAAEPWRGIRPGGALVIRDEHEHLRQQQQQDESAVRQGAGTVQLLDAENCRTQVIACWLS